ncbi:hypothetical protein B1H26_22165 [Amycolatopsis sp. BJA-103]|nr:hypothetical protein BKN51_12400 [Amycolatopsis sp. BJA-103]PNE17620.1 hypothetical protein B1H26_22165 [Amycolatopsis sp. BJA-103]
MTLGAIQDLALGPQRTTGGPVIVPCATEGHVFEIFGDVQFGVAGFGHPALARLWMAVDLHPRMHVGTVRVVERDTALREL